MTTPASPKIVYHDPDQSRNHARRSSTRRSAMAGTQLESPRTFCPADGDAFTYNPAHLSTWLVPLNVWEPLPEKLKAVLVNVQHSGAAVLTGFERIENHAGSTVEASFANTFNSDDLSHLDTLPSPRLLIPSTVSSAGSSDLASPVSMNSSNLPSPLLSSSQSMFSVSPICLSPSDSQVFDKRERRRERSFTTPLEPSDAYYRTELSHLRTEALPRLRHVSLKVDTEWYNAKRLGELSDEETSNFEAWWLEKKSKINQLNEQGTRLCTAIGLTSSGLGWTAP